MQDSEHGRWIHGVVEQYEAALVRYAAQLAGDVETGRDIVQEAFLRLCQQAPGSLDGHVVPWLYTVCRNRALDVRRKEQRMQSVDVDRAESHPSRQLGQAAAVEQRELTDRVLRSIETLSENQQEVVRLKFQHGLSYKEIAEITQLSVSNVGVLLHTAIKKLRAELGVASS